MLASELAAFRSAVGGWAERDMRARTLLAADSLGPAIATGDFRRIREFGDGCRDDGVRLTILSVAGGIIYDSSTSPVGGHRTRPEVEAARESSDHVGTAIRRSRTTGTEMFYCAQLTGESIVRLAVPLSRFYAPFQRARLGLVLAGLVGAASFLFIFIFTHQLRARIRERERQLAELRRAERFRSEFIANLTHEIKTPLTGILGAVDLLDGGDELPQDNRKTLYGLLRGESVRLNVLAQDILELAHLEEQQRDENHDFAPADLADIVRSVQMRLQPKADAANVRLVAGDLPPVTVPCDARLVEHAVANLVIDVVVFEYPAVFGHHQVEWCAFGHLRWGWALNKFLFRQMGNYPYRLTWTHMEGMDKSHESLLFIGFQVRPREIEFRRFVQGPEEIYDLYNNSANTVYAQNNYWKTATTQDAEGIENCISHKVDNPTLGEVIFTPFATEDLTAIDEAKATTPQTEAIYSLSGVKLTGLQKGLNIVRDGNKTIKVFGK